VPDGVSLRAVIVVGLGNPGRRYEGTRHNVGFAVADRVAENLEVTHRESLETAGVLRGTIDAHEVILVWPTTFMNRSGEAIREVLERYDATPAELLVVTDDVYLPLGTVRLRLSGSDGGHNGLASVIEAAGTTQIPRLRVGVGRESAPEDLVEFVLGRFDANEQAVLAEMTDTAARCVAAYVTLGAASAMNEFNGRTAGGSPAPTQM
jgi:PTH1 family peptidyl-tRNA hydrolase